MKTATEPELLQIMLHGQEIGRLTRLEGDRSLFIFSETYLDDPERPMLSLAFKDAFGGLRVDQPVVQTRIPPFFANLLPEGHLRQYLAARIGVKTQRDFPLLAALGQDLAGAVQVLPDERWAAPVDSAGGKDPADGGSVSWRFSLAGVQLKFSALLGAHGGLTIPTGGVGGQWIVKLPSATFEGVPENEFAMMTLAGQLGIEVPDLQLVTLERVQGLPAEATGLRGQALAVRRFDREEGKRVHIEDFAQVFGVYPERKYEKASYRNIAEVLWGECGLPAIEEFARRLVFNALIGNADMHLKNWSLIYRDGRRAALAPAYDLVATIAFVPDEGMALKFGRSRRWRDFDVDALARLADKARLPRQPVMETARDTVRYFGELWAKPGLRELLVAEGRSAIDRHLKELPLYRELR